MLLHHSWKTQLQFFSQKKKFNHFTRFDFWLYKMLLHHRWKTQLQFFYKKKSTILQDSISTTNNYQLHSTEIYQPNFNFNKIYPKSQHHPSSSKLWKKNYFLKLILISNMQLTLKVNHMLIYSNHTFKNMQQLLQKSINLVVILFSNKATKNH